MRSSFFPIALVTILAVAAVAWMGTSRLSPQSSPGQIPRTVSALEDRTSRAPDDAAAWKALGAAYRKEGRLKESATAYVRASRLTPGDPEIITALRDMAPSLTSE